MTTNLVTLARPDVPWLRSDHALVIGKDILELLSSSMYIDPMALYREYIQNAADSVDLARAAGVPGVVGKIEVKVDANERVILIRDDGAGLCAAEFIDRLTALGGSRKRGTQARGFRGVGRLAGLAFGRELFFRSRQESEPTVHEMRWSARDVRDFLRSSEPRDLNGIVHDSVHTRELSGHGWPQRFFEVELRGVIRHRDDRLLNKENVYNYLAQVGPVPFHPGFRFTDEIASSLQKHGVRLGAIDIDVLGIGKVYRPHRNSLAFNKTTETEFRELTIIPTAGREGNTSAVTWILHSDYRGALPQSSLVDGWRFRAGDIQIGNNDLLAPLFAETRFNAWCVAETHVLDGRILPNGRRDHFEHNSFYSELVSHLAPHARKISQRCRATSIYRNLLRHIDTGLGANDATLKALRKRAMIDGSGARIAEQVVRDLDRLQRLAARSAICGDLQKKYFQQISKLRKRVASIKNCAAGRSALDSFTPAQQAILTEVLHSIYASDQDLHRSQALVDRILRRLGRKLRRKV
ncbi:MAG: ATP-binding protein [Terriglobia bacterium]